MRTALLVALLALASSAHAADPKIPYQKYKLPNGLTVLLAEDHRLPLVSVNVWYNASPANEPDKRSGFAHLFEHMMFEGSKHVSGHIKILEENGVTLWNGTTDFDRTNYFETLPGNRLELALWLESDRMGFLVDALDKAKFENEREVVRNERRQSVENAPYATSEEALVQALFPKDHPYHGNIIGSHEDLDAATVEDVANFHRQFYTPRNAVIAIAGDFKSETARALVQRYFGPIPGGKLQPDRKVPLPSPIAQRIIKEDSVSLPRVWFGWVTTPVFGAGDAELDLTARVLGGGRSSRLYKHLVYDQQVASDARCSRQALQLGSILECYATARPGKSAEEVEHAMQAEIAAVRAAEIAADEIDRARNTIFAQAVHQLEQLGGFGGKSDVLQYYEHYLSDPDHIAADFERYRAATPSSMLAAIRHGLDDAHRVTVVTQPKKKGAAR